MKKEEMKVWRKLLGTPIQSFTFPEKKYTVFFDGEKWTCDCPDYKFRKGSYILKWKEDGESKTQRGCKHIAKCIAKTLGVNVELYKDGCYWTTYIPQYL